MLKLAGSSLNSYFVHYSFEKGKEAVMNYHCKKEVRKGGMVLKLSKPEVECGREAKPWLFCFLFLCPVCFLLTLLPPNPTSPTPSCPSAWTCTQHWGNYSSACSGKWAKGISLSQHVECTQMSPALNSAARPHGKSRCVLGIHSGTLTYFSCYIYFKNFHSFLSTIFQIP